jgi:hypothetical protein
MFECPVCGQPASYGFDGDVCHEDTADAVVCSYEGFMPGEA